MVQRVERHARGVAGCTASPAHLEPSLAVMVKPAQTDQVGPVIRPAKMQRHDVVELVPSAYLTGALAFRAKRLLGSDHLADLAQTVAGEAALAHCCTTDT